MPSVTAETRVMTKEVGYIPIATLVGRSVSVWNGEWSKVTPSKGALSQCVRITFDNGLFVDCARDASLALASGVSRVDQLVVGDRVAQIARLTSDGCGLKIKDPESDGFQAGVTERLRRHDSDIVLPFSASLEDRTRWVYALFRSQLRISPVSKNMVFVTPRRSFAHAVHLLILSIGLSSRNGPSGSEWWVELVNYHRGESVCVSRVEDIGVLPTYDIASSVVGGVLLF